MIVRLVLFAVCALLYVTGGMLFLLAGIDFFVTSVEMFAEPRYMMLMGGGLFAVGVIGAMLIGALTTRGVIRKSKIHKVFDQL